MTIFEKIIAGEIPAHIVWQDESHVAFLDIKPINPGHLLVVPKKAVEYAFDMPDSEYATLLLAAKKIAGPLKQVTGAKRIGLVIEGFGVNHVHVHLIPINAENELNPQRAREAAPEELTAMAEKLKAALAD